MEHEIYMNRCLELAKNGLGTASPNPMVGCVIVKDGYIIGEGWHRKSEEPHAEVNAINSVVDHVILQQATLYVSLEPCSHHGKTPPCVDLIVEKKIPKVVIACRDKNSKVNGRGIEKLQDSGIEVTEAILQKEVEFLNRRFFTYHTKKRPYVILKWAQTLDGFMDKNRKPHEKGVNWITNPYTKARVHRWRACEDAILVGTQTVLNDDPELTVKELKGKDPLRIIIDCDLKIPSTARIFNNSNVMVFHHKKHFRTKEKYVELDFKKEVISQILNYCYQKNIQSVLVEGGATTLEYFINQSLWDEARVIIGNITFGNGLKAPKILTNANSIKSIGKDLLLSYYNRSSDFHFENISKFRIKLE